MLYLSQPAEIEFRSTRRRRIGLMIEWLLLAIPFVLQSFGVGVDADDIMGKI